jgi:F0F1-type ATP synthase delta subunit
MPSRLSRRKIADYYAKSLIGGADASRIAQQLAAYLIENRRTKELGLMISDIEYQLSLNGVLLVDITSAYTLDDLTKKAIVNMVIGSTNASDVQLSENLDPGVLGGVKLSFAGNELDATIAKQLMTLKTNYKK